MANQLKSNIPQFLSQLQEVVDRETEKAATSIKQDSQNEVPVKTGKLRDSAYTQKIVNGYRVGYSATYAAYVEFKKRFFRKAVLKQEQTFIQNLKRAINDLMGRF